MTKKIKMHVIKTLIIRWFGFWGRVFNYIDLYLSRIIKIMKTFIGLITLLTSVCLLTSNTNNQQFETAVVGFYNLENLFDTLDSPHTEDSEFLPNGAKQWNTPKYEEKLNHLAKVISEIGLKGNPDGAAILGVCEIENKSVLEDLVKQPSIKNRNYGIVHYDSPDHRGVDVGLLYAPKYFEVTNSKSYTLHMGEDFATRDQLLVSGKLRGEQVHFIVCHWPSRRGGEKASRPKRVAAAELAKHIMDSITAIEPNAKIMMMGDLNDDPSSVSVKKTFKPKSDPTLVNDQDYFNPMFKLNKQGIGTLAWRDNWNLFDQMVMTSAFVKDETGFKYFKTYVFNENYLRQQDGNFKGYPFRSYVGPNYQGGYSDHFPVFTIFTRPLAD